MRRVKRASAWKMGSFRLIRCLGIDVNVVRLKKHFKRLEQRRRSEPLSRRTTMKVRRRQRAKKLASIAA